MRSAHWIAWLNNKQYNTAQPSSLGPALGPWDYESNETVLPSAQDTLNKLFLKTGLELSLIPFGQPI